MKKYLIYAAVLASLVLLSGCFGKTNEEYEPNVNDEYTAETENKDTETENADGKNQDVIKWFDEYADKNYPDNIADFSTEDYPDTVFKCDGNNVFAEKDGETQLLYSGMPIWNVYFADLTGDGKPELCSGISFGSGVIDEHIVVYDYVNRQTYQLIDRMNYDYTLELQNGKLTAVKRKYLSDKTEETGILKIRNGELTME